MLVLKYFKYLIILERNVIAEVGHCEHVLYDVVSVNNFDSSIGYSMLCFQ